jgi:hypothetical protein
MGSTLRSLVLRYKAEIKDFQKGNRRVIDDIKQTKRDVGGLSKEMGKAFAPKVDRMRDQIKRLNTQFREGRMDVYKYGTAVDQLKQKIASMNRISQIRSHEVGALRARSFAAASADKNLRNAFSGSMTESADMIRARMSGDIGGGGNAAAAAAAAGFLPRRLTNFGTLGKVAKVAGPAAALGKIAWGIGGRASDLAAGGHSDTLGPLSRPVGDTVRGAGALAGSLFQRIEDALLGVAGLAGDYATGGMVSRYGRSIKADENRIAAADEAKRIADQRHADVTAARSPMDELKNEQRINALIKDRDYMQVQALARQAEEKGNLEDTAQLYAKMAEMERASAAAAKERADAGERYKQAMSGAVWVDMEKQLEIARNIQAGDTPSQAAMRAAGADKQTILRARGIDLELQQIHDLANPAQKKPGGGSWDWMFEPGKRKLDQDRARVAAFGDQFATPQEIFKKNLKEIQSMMTLGLDPAIAQRAMRANAAGLAGSEGGQFSRFAPSAEVGSREDMAMRDAAKAQNKQEKRIGELVDVQKKALDKLGKIADEGAINIVIQEVSI